MSRVRDKSQLEKMRLYGIFDHNTKFHCFKGGEVIESQEGKSGCQNLENPHDLQVFNGLAQFY